MLSTLVMLTLLALLTMLNGDLKGDWSDLGGHWRVGTKPPGSVPDFEANFHSGLTVVLQYLGFVT